MIIKNFELEKIKKSNLFLYLLYGQNEGLKKHVIENCFIKNFKGLIEKYDEKEVIENQDEIHSKIFNKSFFENEKIILNNNVHIGVAVGIEDGLVVPVIKNADKESLHSINSKVRDYAVRAKSKKLRPDEIEGSTFTISNLGMFGIQEFTSIINQPNSAILSVGAIVKKPIVVNEKVERPALTFIF